MSEIIPAPGAVNTFIVVAGATEQSWVNLDDPLVLEFEYVQRIAEVLEATCLTRPAVERIRVVHVGGGGLTLPRYIASRRPHTAQLVLEPDIDLIEQVRRRLPLPARSGIKIRAVDGATGIAQLPAAYADCIIVDAFDRAQVPGELATVEFFTDLTRVLVEGGVLLMNLTGKAPFTWVRRAVAGIIAHWDWVCVSAETPVWKGRRFGNFVVAASDSPLPFVELERAITRAAFPHRLCWGKTLTQMVGSASPFTVAAAESSPPFEPWL